VWQNPEEVLREIGLRSGDSFVDVGCGEGFFAIPAAKMLGPNGRVYGLDVDEDAIKRLNDKSLTEGLGNICLKVGSAEKTIFCESCADFVFFGIDLHDFEDPSRVLANAHIMLRPKGKLVDLDWKKRPMEFGPPLEKRFDEEKAVRLIEGAGFSVVLVKDTGPYHYLILAEKA
jgi:ubiquinone/menaquinone biosynthesis C-methylase UbiE